MSEPRPLQPKTPYFIELSDIEVPEDWNVRSGAWDGDEEFESLCASIKEHGGNFDPIMLRRNQTLKPAKPFKLVAGFRRMRALERNQLTHAFATVAEMTDAEARTINVAENIREDLKPADLTVALAEMHKLYRLDVQEIARRVGLSAKYVWRLLQLAERLSPDVMRAWRSSPILVSVNEVETLQNLPEHDQAREWRTLLEGACERKGPTKNQPFSMRGQARALGKHLGVLARFGFITISPDINWRKALARVFPTLSRSTQSTEQFRQGYEEQFKRSTPPEEETES